MLSWYILVHGHQTGITRYKVELKATGTNDGEKRNRKGLKADEDRTEANNWKGQTDLFGGSLLKRHVATPRPRGHDRPQGHIRIDLFIYLYINIHQLSPCSIYSLLWMSRNSFQCTTASVTKFKSMFSYNVWDTYPVVNRCGIYLRASNKILISYYHFDVKYFQKHPHLHFTATRPPSPTLYLYVLRTILK